MGEFELLARIRERLPAAGPRIHLGSGDDAAVTVPGGATATSVDALVDGVHFRREDATPAQIGHKALATALSDLAAMGAEPGEAYVVLGVPADYGEDECLELLDGMLALASVTDTDLAGGDLTRAAQLFLAITVVGHAPDAEALIHRAGARVGDALVITDEIGAAAAGLLPDAPAELRARQLEPQPRLGAGRALALAGATAMIDLSDGLGGDARHLAESSGVALRIDAGAIPFAPGSKESMAAAGRDPWELLGGGEDYELLASLPPEQLEAATEAVRVAEGIALTKIGEAVAGSGVEIRLPGGRLVEPGGFDQLA
ncbi:MAG TPA: thiamine-phosphate kinase [Solirubrobacterales bacterium]|jgi:thiamine-monophosphate kinase